MKLVKLIMCGVFALVTVETANATVINVGFTGTINNVGSDVTGFVSLGDSMSGLFSYDTDTDLALSFSITLGGVTLTSSGQTINVQNDQQNGSSTNPADGMTIYGSLLPGDLTVNNYAAQAFQFGLRRDIVTVGQLWNDTETPGLDDWANITLDDINAPGWHWLSFDVPGASTSDDIRWEVTGYTASSSSVPEPLTVVLLGTGLLVISVVRRARLQQMKL